jgi:hypothetical protein
MEGGSMNESALICQDDDKRREEVLKGALHGLDYVELDDQVTLKVYFMGKAPKKIPDGCIKIEGGKRICDIKVTSVKINHRSEPKLGDCMVVKVDKAGDFSTYTLKLVDLDSSGMPTGNPLNGFDPLYSQVEFSFKASCKSDLDCRTAVTCQKERRPEPDINYLAKDYASFRQLIFDRLALNLPDWREQHIPDFGVMLSEILAYTGDYLSYYQDAVATEAYLNTARLRTSVRRHVRLIDYPMHEGCNYRAWISVGVIGKVVLDASEVFFTTGFGNLSQGGTNVLTLDNLKKMPSVNYEPFEIMIYNPPDEFDPADIIDLQGLIMKLKGANDLLSQDILSSMSMNDETLLENYDGQSVPSEPLKKAVITGLNRALQSGRASLSQIKETYSEEISSINKVFLYEANSRIKLYSWGKEECCLPTGSTRATLIDTWVMSNTSEEGQIHGPNQSQNQAHQSQSQIQQIPKPDGSLERCLHLKKGDVLIFEEVKSPVSGAKEDADPSHRHAVRLTSVKLSEDKLRKTVVTVTETSGPSKSGPEQSDSVKPIPSQSESLQSKLSQSSEEQSSAVNTGIEEFRVEVPEKGQAKHTGSSYPEKLVPTPLVEIEWDPEDALPFPVCISAVSKGLDCRLIGDISIVLGNVVLVDHGRTFEGDIAGIVPDGESTGVCDCGGLISEVIKSPGKFRPFLEKSPLTFCEPLPDWGSATALLKQDPRKAEPAIRLKGIPSDTGKSPQEWISQRDLLSSGPSDRNFVAEIDDYGRAFLRFGDGRCGKKPDSGTIFKAAYRIGIGQSGNVGPETISNIVIKGTANDGIVSVRNPLPSLGGADPEPIDKVKLVAPGTIRKELKRAIIADDYAKLAERNPKVQRAAAFLRWTGSWYEAYVAIDQIGKEEPDQDLLEDIREYLEGYRRMGHDLTVVPARHVPLEIAILVCVKPHYLKAHIKAALKDLFSNRKLHDGSLGYFHPDNLSFGESIRMSKIVAAAQAVEGVESVTVTKLQKYGEGSSHEIENGILPLGEIEIAQVDNDPSLPENGQFSIVVGGGR